MFVFVPTLVQLASMREKVEPETTKYIKCLIQIITTELKDGK